MFAQANLRFRVFARPTVSASEPIRVIRGQQNILTSEPIPTPV